MNPCGEPIQPFLNVYEDSRDASMLKKMADKMTKGTSHKGLNRSIIIDVSMDCMEVFQVFNYRNELIQGSVWMVLRNECRIVYDLKWWRLRGGLKGQRVKGQWQIIDIDDFLDGNTWHWLIFKSPNPNESATDRVWRKPRDEYHKNWTSLAKDAHNDLRIWLLSLGPPVTTWLEQGKGSTCVIRLTLSRWLMLKLINAEKIRIRTTLKAQSIVWWKLWILSPVRWNNFVSRLCLIVRFPF